MRRRTDNATLGAGLPEANALSLSSSVPSVSSVAKLINMPDTLT